MKVLAALPNYSLYCGEAKTFLQEHGIEVIENKTERPLSAAQLRELAADVDGVIAGVDVWDDTVMASAPKLKGIARFGVGVDNIDLEAAKKRGIVVSNCPGINTESVAEHAIMLILDIMRFMPFLNEQVRAGRWTRVMVRELRGKTVGLIGFGAVARNLAEKLNAFQCNVIAYDKYPNREEAERLHVRLCGLEEVFAESEILSMHVPAAPDTVHLLNRDTLSLCRDGVYMINTSRGCVVEEEAVYEGLKSGKIAGYGSDVFETEPVTKEYPLFEFDNYVCTPHTAAESYENYAQTGMMTARVLLDVFAGKEPENRLV